MLKRIAGNWYTEKYQVKEYSPDNSCGFQDGAKLMCMDGIYKALKNQTCLIYSFGLCDDWDFEIFLAELGMDLCGTKYTG